MAAELSTWQSPETPVAPFWHRMPKFFLFPAQPAPLARVAATALAVAIAAWIFGRNVFTSPGIGTLVLLLAVLIASVVIARYGFLVIERTAAGYLSPKQYPEFGEQGSPYRPCKMFAILAGVPVLIVVASGLLKSALLLVLLLVAFALLLPASTIVLTMTDSLIEAVNPARCLKIARKIGKPYLVLCLFLLLLMLSSQQAADLVLPNLVGSQLEAQAEKVKQGASPQVLVAGIARTFAIGMFVTAFIANYFFVLMCALLGYVMYQYAGALGVSVVGPGEARTLGRISSAEHQRRARDALIGQMVAAGEIKEAIETLSSDLRDRPNDLSLHGRLHKLLLIEGAAVRIEDHTERYLELLLKTDNAREALPLVAAAFARKADYQPRNPSHVVPLARGALAAGKMKLATQLVRGFDKRYPMHADVPNVYLLGAQLMQHSGAPPAQALGVLKHLIGQFPRHPAAVEAKRMVERLGHGDQ